jgi:chondroitin AC lyase
LKDLEAIRQRIVAESHTDKPNLKAAKGLVASQKPDGSWEGIDYGAQDRALWAPMAHLDRLMELARAYESGHVPEADRAPVSQAFQRGFDYWVTRDPKSSNWWYNEIGAPLEIYRLMVLAEPLLTEGRKERGCTILERAKLTMTGQNLLWLAESVIGRACLQRDVVRMGEAFARIQDEIVISEKEGIQQDFSFHQHGAQLYNGGYGSGFAASAPRFALLAQGTSFAFAQEKLDILTAYLLDGQQWMIRANQFDYSASGRELTRPNSGHARGYAGRARTLLKLDSVTRRDELERMAVRLEKGVSADRPALTGHRQYWRSDYTVHHRPDFMASVRLTSDRMLQTEVVNEENQLGEHLSDGVMYLYRTGCEYRNIFPVWDWARLPGITVEHDRPLKRINNRRKGSRPFAGGVSDGLCGVSAMEFERDGLTAKKAWFFFEGEVVCLGAGITSTNAFRVITSVNQCLAEGPVTVKRADGAVAALQAPEKLVSPVWVHQGGFVYALLQGGENVGVGVSEQKGNWRRVSTALKTDEVSQEVFSLWLSHGKRPTGAAYAYVASAQSDVAAAGRYADALPVRVVANTSEVQAVEDPQAGILQVAYYRAAALDASGWGTVRVDRPCLLLLRKGGGSLRGAVCDPTNRDGSVKVEAGGMSRLIQLPSGPRAGSSARFEG